MPSDSEQNLHRKLGVTRSDTEQIIPSTGS